MRQHQEEEKVKYGAGGATRSKMLERYDLIPPIASKAEAIRYGIGVEKHGEGNWKHGDKQFVKSLFNHLLAHYNDLLVQGMNKNESVLENIGAIKWAASGLAWYSFHRNGIYTQAVKELHEGLEENVQHTEPRKTGK